VSANAGAGSGALSALPRLQLELTAFTRHTVCSVTPPPPELQAEGMGKGERVLALKILWSLVHRDKPQRMTQTDPLPAYPLAVALHETLTVPRVDEWHLQVIRNRVLRFT